MTRLPSEIRILPPLAIARLGSAPEPVDNYDLEVREDEPLGSRRIVPAPTLVVDEETGAIVARELRPVAFKDAAGRVRPVAPFLELWGRDGDDWRHLTMHDLRGAEIRWRAAVANLKVWRRTGDVHDRVEALTGWFSDHVRVPLHGRAKSFLAGKHIPFGDVRFVRPTDEFPELRVRYTPAHGSVYGADAFVRRADGTYAEDPPPGRYLQYDANLRDVVYDASVGRWLGWNERTPPSAPHESGLTIPSQIFAGQRGADAGDWISRGYLDDQCDGAIEVEVHAGGRTLTSFARITSGPPVFAPDSYPIRTVSDELEQALLGPAIEPGDYTDDELQAAAEEILRRAFETIRLMNTAVLNGNPFRGRLDVTPTMVRGDRMETARAWEPIMAPTIVDNLALRSLHQSIFTVLRGGAPPGFAGVLRRFDEIGDLTDHGRRKMPAMIRNADGRYLCLTRRQYETLRLAALRASRGGGKGTP